MPAFTPTELDLISLVWDLAMDADATMACVAGVRQAAKLAAALLVSHWARRR